MFVCLYSVYETIKNYFKNTENTEFSTKYYTENIVCMIQMDSYTKKFLLKQTLFRNKILHMAAVQTASFFSAGL